MRRRGLALPVVVAACLATSAQHLGCSADPSGSDPDTDGDGLSDQVELTLTGTSPLMPDTDGDGLNDYQEAVTLGFDPSNDPTHFNPRVADLPLMVVALAGPPVLTIQATDEYGTTYSIADAISNDVSVGVSVSVSPMQSQADTQSVSQTNMNGTSLTIPLGGSGGGGADAGRVRDGGRGRGARDASTGQPDNDERTANGRDGGKNNSGATLTLDNSVATTVNPSTTFTTSITFTNSQMQTNDQTLSETRTIEEHHTVVAQTADLKVAAVVYNQSDVAFKVTNLSLGASFVDPDGVALAVQNLDPDEGVITTFQPFALAPGEHTGIITFVTIPLTLDTAQAILTRANQLFISLGVYELDDEAGKPYAFDVQALGTRTALFVIDYGQLRRPEMYQVATNGDPAHPGITAGKILGDILRVPYSADPQTGLTAVRDVAVHTSGGPHWSVTWMHKEGPDFTTTPFGAGGEPYDFDGITVHAGDVLQLHGPGAPPDADGGVSSRELGTGPSGADDAGIVVPRGDAALPIDTPDLSPPDLPDANLSPTAPTPSVRTPSSP